MFKKIFHSYKRSFTGLTPEIWWLSLVLLINRSGTMVAPFLSIYLTQQLHYSLTYAGIVIGVLGLGSMAGALIGGKLTDKFGHIHVQLLSLLGGGFLFILLGYIENFGWLCVVTFILSLVNDAFRPANSAAIAVYSAPENRTRSYSLNRLAVNIGWAVGVTAGGILAGIGYRFLFWVDGLTNILAALLLWQLLFRKKAKKYDEIKTETGVQGSSPWKDAIYMRFIILITLYLSCFMLMFRIVPVYYKEELHLSEAVIGMVMGLNGIIIALFEMLLVSRWEGKRSHLMYIRLGLYLGAISFIALLLPLQAVLLSVLVMVIFTFSEILALPFMNSFWINRTSANNRGAYAAVFTLSWSVAQVLGPYVGALVVDHGSYQILWIGAFALSVVCGLGIYFLKERPVITTNEQVSILPVQKINAETQEQG